MSSEFGQIPIEKIAVTAPDLIVEDSNLFRLGSINYLGRFETPGLIEVIGTNLLNPEDRGNKIRIPYVVKVAMRVPTHNGKEKFHNQGHMYRWYDHFEVKKGSPAPHQIPYKDLLDSLDFMLFEARGAYAKLGYDFDYSVYPDGARMAKYIAQRLIQQGSELVKL